MQAQALYLCVSSFNILLIVGVSSQDAGCISSDSLLEGRRRIVGATFRANSDRSGNRAYQARLDDPGWCSGLLATNIFDPYIEVDFGRDVLFTAVATQGADSFTERYRIQVAGEDHHLQYIALSANISQFEPAIFPLGQSMISNDDRHMESLPRPVVGQVLRINPYQWSDDDHVCTRLEVYGCPLQECQPEIQLNSNQYVDEVTVNGSPINPNNLFEFDDTDVFHCGPDNVGSFDIIISYSSPVLLREIGIHGNDQIVFDDYVTRFSLSFSEDGDNFTDYIRDTGSPEFTVSDARRHYFGLWPPITASDLKITINSWNDRPCMSLLMLGCNYSDVVDHSINITNRTDSGSDFGLRILDDLTVILTTTESVTITQSTTTTETSVQTTTESFTVTISADVTHTPSPSPTVTSGAAASTSCSSDTDNTPIYVAVVIVIVGLLITIIIVIVGVLLCYRNQKEKESDGTNSSLNVKYTPTNANGVSIVEVDNDLYGKDGLQPQSQSSPASPESIEHPQMMVYDNMDPTIMKEPETADNPQYGDTLKQSEDTTADTKSTENMYSYAIP